MFPTIGVVIGTVRLYSIACDLSLHIKCEILAEAGTQRENSRWGSRQLSNSGDFLKRGCVTGTGFIPLSFCQEKARELMSRSVALGLILNDRILKTRAPSVGTYSYNLGLREYSQSQMLICICLEIMGVCGRKEHRWNQTGLHVLTAGNSCSSSLAVSHWASASSNTFVQRRLATVLPKLTQLTLQVESTSLFFLLQTINPFYKISPKIRGKTLSQQWAELCSSLPPCYMVSHVSHLTLPNQLDTGCSYSHSSVSSGESTEIKKMSMNVRAAQKNTGKTGNWLL